MLRKGVDLRSTLGDDERMGWLRMGRPSRNVGPGYYPEKFGNFICQIVRFRDICATITDPQNGPILLR